MTNLTKKQLTTLAKIWSISGRSKMDKNTLVCALSNHVTQAMDIAQTEEAFMFQGACVLVKGVNVVVTFQGEDILIGELEVETTEPTTLVATAVAVETLTTAELTDVAEVLGVEVEPMAVTEALKAKGATVAKTIIKVDATPSQAQPTVKFVEIVGVLIELWGAHYLYNEPNRAYAVTA